MAERLTKYAIVLIILISSTVVQSASKGCCCDNTIDSKWLAKWGIILGVGIAFTYFVVPAVVTMLGFGPGGIVAGSLAAWIMSVVYSYGIGTVLLAILQSIGATGSATWLISHVFYAVFGGAVSELVKKIYDGLPDSYGNCCSYHVEMIREIVNSKGSGSLSSNLKEVLVALPAMCDLRKECGRNYLMDLPEGIFEQVLTVLRNNC